MRKIFTLLIGALLCPVICIGAYRSEEMCVIPWGDGENELKIIAPHIEAEGRENEDFAAGQGPSIGIVDDQENIFISSYDYGYLKRFSSKGEFIKNLMGHDTQLRTKMNGQTIDGFIIDSSLVYVIGFPGLPVIPIVDYDGNVVNTLEPYDRGQWVEIFELVLNYDGSMSIDREIFRSRISSSYVITYRDGRFYPGGSLGFLASSGSYYSVRQYGYHKLRFNKYENPDTVGNAATRKFTIIEFPQDSIDSAEILNGGDGGSLYVFVINIRDSHSIYEVWEFGLDYSLISKVSFPPAENIYERSIRPFVSRDGTIYEFRCLDDRLHVVKWVKQ